MNQIKTFIEENWQSSGYAVLLFHGVTAIDEVEMGARNSNKKHLKASEFIEILSLLESMQSQFMLMSELEDSIQEDKILEKVVCLTFDDGFRNNLNTAIPLMNTFNAKATIYVTTDFIEKNLMSWIDRVEFAVDSTQAKFLDLHGYSFPMGSLPQKIQCLKDIRKIYKQKLVDKSLLASEIQMLLIHKEVYSNNSDLDQKLTWSEVKRVEEMENFEIGAHTISHPSLSHLDTMQQHFEVEESLNIISKKTGYKINLFAYPEGTPNDFNQSTIDILKNLGIKSSPSAVPYPILNIEKIFSIPRLNCDNEIIANEA